MCNTKYKTKFGMLLELALPVDGFKKIPHYAMSVFSTKGVQYANALAVERLITDNGRDMSTPHQMLQNLPKVVPLAKGSLFRQCKRGEGVDKSDDMEGVFQGVGIELSKLPIFHWDQLFNLVEQACK